MLKNVLNQIVAILRGKYGLPFFILIILIGLYYLPSLMKIAVVLAAVFFAFKFLANKKQP